MAAVETIGYLYNRYRGQKCPSETRTQGFPGQERGIDGSRRRHNYRSAHRGRSAGRTSSYASAETAPSRKLRGGRHMFIWTRMGLRVGDVMYSVCTRPKH